MTLCICVHFRIISNGIYINIYRELRDIYSQYNGPSESPTKRILKYLTGAPNTQTQKSRLGRSHESVDLVRIDVIQEPSMLISRHFKVRSIETTTWNIYSTNTFGS